MISTTELESDIAKTLLSRARALSQGVADRAVQNERDRRISDATIEEFGNAGLYNAWVPTRFGGYELSIEDACKLVIEAAWGCGSSAWVLGFYIAHNWIWAVLPERAQEEVFVESPSSLGPVLLAPSVKFRREGDGYRLSGRAKWGTGIAHAQWVMVAGIEERDDPSPGQPTFRFFLVPASEVIVHETWFTSGMAATSSDDIEFPNLFVPEYRTVDLLEARDGKTEGLKLHNAKLYRFPLYSSIIFMATAPAVALAKGAVAAFRERLTSYVSPLYGKKGMENANALTRLSEVEIKVQAAEQYLYALARQAMEQVTDEGLSQEQRTMIRAGCAHIAAECRDAVYSIAAGAGASSHFLDSPIQRAMRDLSMMACHVLFETDPAHEANGRVMVGLPPNTPFA